MYGRSEETMIGQANKGQRDAETAQYRMKTRMGIASSMKVRPVQADAIQIEYI